MNKKRLSFLPLAIVSAAALTACGGGGGGSDSGSNATAQNAMVSFDESNYVAAAKSVGQSHDEVAETGKSWRGVAGADVSTHSVTTVGALVYALQQRTNRFVTQASISYSGGGDTGKADQIDSSDICKSGVPAQVDLKDSNGNNKLDVGESLDIVFTDCRIDASTVLKGKMGIKLTSLDESKQAMSMILTMTDFSISDATSTHKIVGAVDWSVNGKNMTTKAQAVTTETTEGGKTSRESWANYLYQTTVTNSGSETVVSGVFTSSDLDNKAMEVITVKPLTVTGYAVVPEAGEIKLKGKDNSAVHILVDGLEVKVSVDKDGDGKYESSQPSMNWYEFTGTQPNAS